MAVISTAARGTLATALANVGGTVYAVAPAVPSPPCLVIAADNPWMTPGTMGGALRNQLHFKILVVVMDRDNTAALAEIEEHTEGVLTALKGLATFRDVTPPASTDIGAQGSVLVAEVHITINVKE
jgi:hypothetical protein